MPFAIARAEPEGVSAMGRPLQLSRRTLLRGTGALLALPLLDAMTETEKRAQAAGTPAPRRLVVFHFPTGVNQKEWVPQGSERSWVLSPTLAPLASLQGDICVITGLKNSPANLAAAGHTGGIVAFLTANAVPRSNDKPRVTISMDQLAANQLRSFTPRFPSLQLGTRILNENPNAEDGYSPVYKDHLSWAGDGQGGPTTPLTKKISPSKVFDELFSGVASSTSSTSSEDAALAKRKFYQQSVLDSVRHQAQRLQQRLGRQDNLKLDEYFTSIGELEKRVQSTATPLVASCPVGANPYVGPPSSIEEHVHQMIDLTVLALRCDITRVVTFMYEHTVTGIRHDFLGVKSDYHIGVTHHQNNASKLADYAKVNQWMVAKFALLLEKMKAVQEPDGTLLKNSVVLFGSELDDGNNHGHNNLPIIVAGNGGGMIESGRLLARRGVPLANLHTSLLQTVGVRLDRFGDDGTGPLDGLTTP